MEKILKTLFFMVTICSISISCSDGDDETPVDPPEPPPVSGFTITSIEKLNQSASTINSHADVTSRSSLKMNFRSYVDLGESELGVTVPHYPRIKKMANGNFIMFFNQNQHGGSCYYSISSNLKLWQSMGKIFNSVNITDLTYGNSNVRMFATTDAVVLANGDILAVSSYRARDGGYTTMPRDAGLILRRSTNNGTSWSEPVAIYQGVNWEPYLIQLPSGEIHCYFTDSSRTGIQSKDTGTAMIVSKDNGKTWTPGFGSTPYYVIRSKHTINGNTYFNDQMPSVIKLNGSNELAAVVETTGGDNLYHISLAYSGEDGEWKHLAKDEAGPTDRITKAFSGAAPYLVQFASGETVLSYNSSSKLNMKMGDAKARSFGNSYIPFSGSGFWGTMQLANDHILIGSMPNTSKGTMMLAQFVLNHRITATHRSVAIDGSNTEWADTDHALFVGEKSQAQGTLRCAFDNENVYFLTEVLDNSIEKDDHVAIYLNPVTSDDKLTNEACRIKVSYNGTVISEAYNGNSWTSADLGVSVKAESENSKNDKGGYIVEISIPRSKLTIKSGEMLVNFSLFDNKEEEAIANVSSTSTAKWIPINGL